MKLITINCGNTSRISCGSTHFELGIDLSFTDTSWEPHKANKRWSSLEVANRPLEIQSYEWHHFGNCNLMAWFNLTVTPTISSSIVAIDIDSCSITIG